MSVSACMRMCVRMCVCASCVRACVYRRINFYLVFVCEFPLNALRQPLADWTFIHVLIS